MAKTLFDFYSQQGKKLPSLSERAGLFKNYGGTGAYTGTSAQNTFLLGKLASGGGTSPSLPTGTIVAPARTPEDVLNERRTALTNAMRGLEDPTARIQRLRKEAGLEESEKTLSDLMRQMSQQEQLLTELEPGINERVSNFGLTEAQRQRLLGSERTPLAQTLEKIARAKESQQQTLSMQDRTLRDLLTAAQGADERLISPLQTELGYAQDDFDRYLKERQLAEQRAYEAQQAALSRKSSGSGSGSGSSSKLTEAAASREVKEALAGKAGSDGFVSPASYKAAKQMWQSAGFGPNRFDELFAQYINPMHYERGSGRESYGISPTVFNKVIRPKLFELGIGYDD